VRRPILFAVALAGLAAGALPALGATDHAVSVASFYYAPPSLTIATGDKVVWNHSAEGVAHNVEFDDGYAQPASPDAGAWTVERTFDTPGMYRYFCALHGDAQGEGMAAKVKVLPR